MTHIKTYQNLNRVDPKKDFGISKMEDIYEKHLGLPDKPHRHNFYTILFIQKAEGIHNIDFREYALRNNEVFFISPGQVHQLLEKGKPKGYSMVFSSEFLVKNNIPISFIEDLNLFQDYGYSPALGLDESQAEQLTVFCDEMSNYYHSEERNKELLIGSYLKLFLLLCNNSCDLPPFDEEKMESGHIILKNFKTLVNAHYQERHATSFYADQLHISPDHLNRTVKSLVGKTAKEYIQSRIIVAAKRLLYFSNLTTKEIGYQLGFSEPANFSAFFKKCTDQSPSQFKKIG